MPHNADALLHPGVHQEWSEWSEQQKLHVAIAYSNPFRWSTRRRLAQDCIRHLKGCPNVVLHVGELAYGDRPFELTGFGDTNDVQLRIDRNELFSKENIQNIVVRSFPRGYGYGAVIDADFHFTRRDWALETIQQLQHYKIVQPFSSYADLSGNVYGQKDIPVRYNSGFFFNYIQNGYTISSQYHNGPIPNGILDQDGYEGSLFLRGVGATGGAMAFRESAFDALGGMLDRCIMGHADWYMAFSLVDVEPPDIHSQNYHPHYKHYVNQWREKAQALLKNVGYVDGHAIHYWHGSKTRRGYSSRDVILAKHQYSPYEDVHPSHQGIWQLNPKKIGLRDDIRRYFISRFEDDPNLYSPEKLLV
jgi:hypothetical protein